MKACERRLGGGEGEYCANLSCELVIYSGRQVLGEQVSQGAGQEVVGLIWCFLSPLSVHSFGLAALVLLFTFFQFKQRLKLGNGLLMVMVLYSFVSQ